MLEEEFLVRINDPGYKKPPLEMFHVATSAQVDNEDPQLQSPLPPPPTSLTKTVRNVRGGVFGPDQRPRIQETTCELLFPNKDRLKY
jgi:hypothetical protein